LIAAGILFHKNLAFALTKPHKKVVSNAFNNNYQYNGVSITLDIWKLLLLCTCSKLAKN